MTLDNLAEGIINDTNAQAEAVKTLISAKRTEKGGDSEIELKTDLSIDEVKIHSVLATLNRVMENPIADFKKHCILGSLIESKERKSLSKERRSRSEIVAVAKPPEMPDMGGAIRKEGFIRRMFTPREPTQ